MFLHPSANRLQICGVVPKGLHKLGILRAWHTNHNLLCANVDPRSMRIHLAQTAKGMSFFRSFPAFTFPFHCYSFLGQADPDPLGV